MEASYSQVDDLSNSNLNKPPQRLLDQCKNRGSSNPTRVVTVSGGGGSVSASSVQSQCGTNTICVVPSGLTLVMDGNLNVGALIVRGVLSWTTGSQSSPDQYLCGGYVVVENNGSFDMNLDDGGNNEMGWIYIKNNGAVHSSLRSRAFGSSARPDSNDNPTMNIRGRNLARTWSLLSEPLVPGARTMKLLHHPVKMGWKVGDRLGISPTEPLAKGWGQDVRIASIRNDNDGGATIVLQESIRHNYRADFKHFNTEQHEHGTAAPALLSAEVVNLSRNIVVTGDDFQEIQCDPNLRDEAVPGEETSVVGCRCSSFRSKCHVGLHTMNGLGGVAKIQDVRIEKCGQRGMCRNLFI